MNYQVFFNLDDAPFGLTPDPQYYFPSKRHNEALETLIYCVESGEGFAQITGQPGVGKTLLIRSFLDQLSDNVNTALILHPRLEPEDLIKVILEDLGLASGNMQEMSKESLLRSFRDLLLESAEQGTQTLVIIDEAQEIPEKTLEELRLLSNLETNKAKLLQIILVGQLELEDKLNQDNFKQLHQRITIRYRLNPLTLDETVNYIYHRLKIAGGGTLSRFSPKIIKQIHTISKGIPRIINTLCERSLMAAFVDGKSSINHDHLVNAAQSLGHDVSRTAGRSKKSSVLVFLATVLILAGIAAYFINPSFQRVVDLKTRQLIAYYQTKKMDLAASAQQEAAEKKHSKKVSIESSEKTVQDGRTGDDKTTGVNKTAVLVVGADEEDDFAVNGGQKQTTTVPQVDEKKIDTQIRQPEGEGSSAYISPISIQKTEVSQVPVAEEKHVVPADLPVTSEITENPVTLPPGWKSIFIQQKDQKAFFFQSNSPDPVKEIVLPTSIRLEDGIYLLGQDEGRPFLFNHRSFFAWQVDPSLSRLLFQQFATDTSPPVIPVIVSSTELDTSLSQKSESEIRAMVKSWAAIHSQKDIQSLMHYYGDSLIGYKLFSNNPTVKSHAQIAAKKASIFEKNKAVYLQISEPVCLLNSADPSQAIALFYQRFVSSSYRDSGIKVLYLRKTGANTSTHPQWVITGTLWLPSREEKKDTH